METNTFETIFWSLVFNLCIINLVCLVLQTILYKKSIWNIAIPIFILCYTTKDGMGFYRDTYQSMFWTLMVFSIPGIALVLPRWKDFICDHKSLCVNDEKTVADFCRSELWDFITTIKKANEASGPRSIDATPFEDLYSMEDKVRDFLHDKFKITFPSSVINTSLNVQHCSHFPYHEMYFVLASATKMEKDGWLFTYERPTLSKFVYKFMLFTWILGWPGWLIGLAFKQFDSIAERHWT